MYNFNLDVLRIRPSWRNYIVKFFIAGGLFLIGGIVFAGGGRRIGGWFFLIALVFVLIAVIQRFSRLYTLTRESVSARAGIIARHENEIKLTDIREVGVRQNIIERILRTGTVLFASAATGGVEVKFEGVYDPLSIKEEANKRKKKAAVQDKKRCPQCGEFIWEQAKVCPHCGYGFGEG